MHRVRLSEVDGGDLVRIDFLPAIHMIEQLGRCAFGAQQGRLDFVLLKQAEQVVRFGQARRRTVIDKKLLAIEFGAAVDESCDAVGN